MRGCTRNATLSYLYTASRSITAPHPLNPRLKEGGEFGWESRWNELGEEERGGGEKGGGRKLGGWDGGMGASDGGKGGRKGEGERGRAWREVGR